MEHRTYRDHGELKACDRYQFGEYRVPYVIDRKENAILNLSPPLRGDGVAVEPGHSRLEEAV
jgi:hypothetical protein